MKRNSSAMVFSFLILLLLASLGLSLCCGRYSVPFDQTVSILCSRLWTVPQTWSDGMANVVLNVRLPRIIAGLLVGAALATSGATYQSIFKNPLVSPMKAHLCWYWPGWWWAVL